MSHLSPHVVSPHSHHVVHVEPVVVPVVEHYQAPDFVNVMKVVALMAVPAALWQLEWLVTYGVYSKGASGSVLVLTLLVMFGYMGGAAIGGHLVRTRGNARWVVMLGLLLCTPFFFIFWRFAVNTAATKADDFYWLLCIFGMVGTVGGGIAFAAEVGYVGKLYHCSGSRDTGKVVGYLYWVMPIALLFMVLLGMAVASNTIWALIGAVLVVVLACVWTTLDPACQPAAFQSEVGVWSALTAFLVMIAPWTAVMCFEFVALGMCYGLQQEEKCVVAWVSLFAMVGATIFFGWGFDGCRAKAQNVWNVLACVTLLLVLLNMLGYALNLRILVVVLCVLVDKGGQLFFLAHMLHESARNEASVAAAAVVFWGLGSFIAGTFLTMFAKSMLLQFVLLSVLTLVTIGLAQQGLPTMNAQKYAVLQQHE